MFSAVMQASGVPVKQWAIAAGRAESTAYRWSNGEGEPCWSDLEAMIAHLDTPAVEAMARLLFKDRLQLVATDPQERADLCVLEAAGRAFAVTAEANEFNRKLHEALIDRASPGRVDERELIGLLQVYQGVKRGLNLIFAAAQHSATSFRRCG